MQTIHTNNTYPCILRGRAHLFMIYHNKKIEYNINIK